MAEGQTERTGMGETPRGGCVQLRHPEEQAALVKHVAEEIREAFKHVRQTLHPDKRTCAALELLREEVSVIACRAHLSGYILACTEPEAPTPDPGAN